MYIKLFDLKDEMLRNGEKMIDFTENNFKVNYADSLVKLQRIMLVEDRHICRPDLICFEVFGNLDYIDAILKFNQITNPFSMELYDIIAIPTVASLVRMYQKETRVSQFTRDTKALFLDPKRASQKDINRMKQLAKIASKRKNGSTTPKPTNLLRDGEVPFIADGQRLIFAPSVSTPRFPSSNSLTQ